MLGGAASQRVSGEPVDWRGPRPPGIARSSSALLDLLREGTVPRLTLPEWESFLQLARHHRVRSWAAVELSGEANIPEPARTALRGYRQDNVMVQLRMMAEVRRITEALTAAGLPHLIVKGPALAVRAYNAPEQREYGDVDLLIEPAELPAALAVMEEAGGQLLDRNWPMIRRTQRGELSVVLPFGTNLDVHWSLLNTPALRGAFDLSTAGLLARSTEAVVENLETRILHPDDELIYVALHAALAGANRLVWLLDIKQLAATVTDWQAVVERAFETKTALILSIVFARVKSLLAAEIPAEVIARLARGSVWAVPGRLLERRAVPAWLDGGHSGRTWISSTRANTRASSHVVVAVLRREVIPAMRGRTVPGASVEDLHRDEPGAGDRQAFMDAIKRTR